MAPAGSGKTTTVVARLAWRVALGVTPRAICALTFNRRAAEELQQRADEALGELGLEAGSVRVSTFHALGRAILAESGRNVEHIVERQEVLAMLAAGPLPGSSLRWLDDAFTRLKLDPERGPPTEDVATHRAFADYQDWLAERSAIDLDDLVALAVPALRADARLLDGWRARASVLFVDEAQDLDRAQLDLAVLLAGEKRDIFLVGDDDQTIYAWRLADVRRVLGLATRLPGLRRVDLETNHRCAPEIVHRAARLVAYNRERFSKRIRASPSASGSVTLVPDSGDDVARARWALMEWAQPASSGQSASFAQPMSPRSSGRRAVLARTNRELAPYAAVALELGVPISVEADGLLLDEPGLLETIDLAAARMAAHEPVLPVLPALAAAAQERDLDAELSAALLGWAAPFHDLAALRSEVVKRVTARRTAADPAAALTLATIHGTKGLEWDHVLCVGHDDGAFPSGRALREAVDPSRALEEERRLAYVAWTRARKTLTVVYDPGAPSQFLLEAFDAGELP